MMYVIFTVNNYQNDICSKELLYQVCLQIREIKAVAYSCVSETQIFNHSRWVSQAVEIINKIESDL